jgi:M42 glutamyl aminopeptidase
MQTDALQFLKDLLHAPSPSGYERPVQEVVRRFAKTFTDDIKTDWHGNVMAAVNPNGFPRIMLAGHCDQIGLLVKHIDDKGFLWVHAIGGWDPQVLIGQSVQVWTKQGPVAGVIARKPIHLQSPEDRKVVPEIKNLWVDIAVQDGTQLPRDAERICSGSGNGQQGRRMDRPDGGGSCREREPASCGLRRFNCSGRDRSARCADQRISDRSTARHRRRCHSCHRLSHDR